MCLSFWHTLYLHSTQIACEWQRLIWHLTEHLSFLKLRLPIAVPYFLFCFCLSVFSLLTSSSYTFTSRLVEMSLTAPSFPLSAGPLPTLSIFGTYVHVSSSLSVSLFSHFIYLFLPNFFVSFFCLFSSLLHSFISIYFVLLSSVISYLLSLPWFDWFFFFQFPSIFHLSVCFLFYIPSCLPHCLFLFHCFFSACIGFRRAHETLSFKGTRIVSRQNVAITNSPDPRCTSLDMM